MLDAKASGRNAKSPLPRFVAGVLFVDDVNAAFALHDFTIGVALFKRFKRVGNFHDHNPFNRGRKVGG